jgi:hypothetical protein
MANGFALSAYEMDLNDAEARVRDETNSEIEAARGAIKECIRLVTAQAKGSAADFSEVDDLLDQALRALPEVRS